MKANIDLMEVANIIHPVEKPDQKDIVFKIKGIKVMPSNWVLDPIINKEELK